LQEHNLQALQKATPPLSKGNFRTFRDLGEQGKSLKEIFNYTADKTIFKYYIYNLGLISYTGKFERLNQISRKINFLLLF
jgi:hypothetical protein